MLHRLANFLIASLNFLLFHHFAIAQAVVGGGFEYECIGNGDYRVTLEVVHQCGAGRADSIIIAVQGNGAGCGGSTPYTMSLVDSSSTDMTYQCADSLSQCAGGMAIGFRSYYYQFDYSPPNTTCNWDLIFASNCCRVDGVNVANGSTASYQIDAEIPASSSGCNNSAKLLHKVIPKACTGVSQHFDLLPFDPEGDSILTGYGWPTLSNGSAITYANGYGLFNTIDGFSEDLNTGQQMFAPQLTGYYLQRAFIIQYDATGSQAGYVSRDYLVDAQACPANDQPRLAAGGGVSISSGNATLTDSLTLEVCQGSDVCLNMFFTDADTADAITAITDFEEVFPGAIVTSSFANPLTLSVCFTPPTDTTGTFPVVVSISDSVCPVPGVRAYLLKVVVKSSTIAGEDKVICGSTTAQLEALGGSSYAWTVLSGDPIVVGNNFSCDSCANPIASPDTTTLYLVSGSQTNGCPSFDTVRVKRVPDFGFSISTTSDTICSLADLSLAAVPQTGGNYSYQWTPSTGLVSDTDSVYTPRVQQVGDVPFVLSITNDDGCEKKDTVSIHNLGGLQPVFQIMADSMLCTGQSRQLNLQHSNASCHIYVELQDFAGNGWNNAYVEVYIDDAWVQTLSMNNGFTLLDSVAVNNNDLLSMRFFEGTADYQLGLVVTTHTGDTLYYEPMGNVGPPPGELFSSVVNCTQAPPSFTFAWQPVAGLLDATAEHAVVSPFVNTTYHVVVTDTTTGCLATDSILLTVQPNFSYSVTQSDSVACQVDTIVVGISTGPGSYTYDWDYNDLVGTDTLSSAAVVLRTPGLHTIYVAVSDSQCTNHDSISVLVSDGHNPNLTISGDTLLCPGASSQLAADVGVPNNTPCTWTLDMFDSLADDWQGATITIYLDGNSYGQFSAIGAQTTQTIEVLHGQLLELEYTPFAFENENSYTLTNGAGQQVFADGPTPGAGLVYTATDLCPTAQTHYQIAWTPSGGLSATDVLNPVASPTAAQSYQLIVADTLGQCADTAVVHLNFSPDFTVQVFGNDSAVCQGDSSSILALASGVGAFTYQWVGNQQYSDNNVQMPTVVWSNAGASVNIAIATNGNGCSRSDTIMVQVDAPQSLQLSSPGSICSNDVPIALSASPTGGIWSGSGIVDSLAGAFDPTLVGQGAAQIHYSLQTTCAETDSLMIQVVGTPDATIADPGQLCSGDGLVVLSAAADSGSWSGIGIVDTVAGILDPAAFGGDSTLVLFVAVDTNGCSSADSLMITVLDSPDPTIATQGPVCEGSDPILLSAADTGGVWQGVGLADSTSGQWMPTNAGVGTHWVTYGFSGQCAAVDSAAIEVQALPVAPTVAGDSACIGDTIVLQATGGGGTLTWYADSAGASVGIGANLEVAVLNDSIFWVQETSAIGCVGPATSAELVGWPAATASVISGSTGVEELQTQTYTVNGTAGSDYQWSTTGGAIQTGQGTNTVVVFWQTIGLHELVVTETTSNGCTSVASKDVNVGPDGIGEVGLPKVKVYPNPARDWVMVESEVLIEETRVYNTLGQDLLKNEWGDYRAKINLSDLPNGVYLLVALIGGNEKMVQLKVTK